MYDCIVIGAGHAGCEAALASARMGAHTLLVTLHIDQMAMMPCNPAVGGTAKGQLVREIDALGGEMALAADATMLQSRMLNTGKGPAVRSLRVQVDRLAYQRYMQTVLFKQPGLDVLEDEASEILVEQGKARGLKTVGGRYFHAVSIVIATGVYLDSVVHVGAQHHSGGPAGLKAATYLSKSLAELGVRLLRMRTDTTPRLDYTSIDFSTMIPQLGDDPIVPFSYLNDRLQKRQLPCHLTYTNIQTHKIIQRNYHRLPDTTHIPPPRYCPSIEEKIHRFSGRNRHQVFLERESLEIPDVYMQGMTTALPKDAQQEMVHSMAGLEQAVIRKYGYGIEYDCIDATQLRATLELKTIEGLFFAGQVNGTSGYEEAGAQGILAGINACARVQGKPAFMLQRDEAYLGVLVDDLITKGTNEPYRMMTSRAEYRLLLRSDNADLRLTERSAALGLASGKRLQLAAQKREWTQRVRKDLEETSIPLNDRLQSFLQQKGYPPAKQGLRAIELLRRKGVSYADLCALAVNLPTVEWRIAEQVEIEVKYEGYIRQQIGDKRKFDRMENRRIPINMDYISIRGLSTEAQEKLQRIQPASLGQAARISGVSPADISILLVYLRRKGEK